MFENDFTAYLLMEGWIRSDVMSFTNQKENIKIDFDTSNQIEVFENGMRRGGSVQLVTCLSIKYIRDWH